MTLRAPLRKIAAWALMTTTWVVIACARTAETPFVPPVVYDGGIGTFGEGGVDPTLGEPCTETAQCDDGLACTFDRCDQEIGRCRHTPDDAQCQNDAFCDGRERCVPRMGCQPGPPESCSDGDTCTIDHCVEETDQCERTTRDADGDGDATAQCAGGRDCDDANPAVSGAAAEVCGNGRDDNCNGTVDEMPCSTAANDTCASPLRIAASGTFFLSTIAAQADYTLSCAGALGVGLRDVVADIVVPDGLARDVEVWASSIEVEVALSISGTCGSAGSELACTTTARGALGRIRARSLAPGHYTLTVATRGEAAVDVNVAFLSPTIAPTNETCATAAAIGLGVSVPVSIISHAVDHPTTCTRNGGEIVYAFTLAEPSDVRVYSAVTRGSGKIVTSLRDGTATCGELRCKNDSEVPIFARNLAAGTHRITVSATQSVDGTILVQTSAPTMPPPEESCATAAALIPNRTFPVDLTNREGAIDTGCAPGAANAAYKLDLTEASDVLIVARFAPGESGSVSLHGTACTMADSLGCLTSSTPARLTKRNLAAGSYRVVVAHEDGRPATLGVFVRSTVAPTAVTGADTCAAAFAMPATGGYFTGSTTGANADYAAGCDSPGGPNAKDQILRLALTDRKRVLLDMNGSTYATILDVRDTTGCPGAELAGLCYVGFTAVRSFLDLTLAAGSYYIQIDGYNGASGDWVLDARVLDP